jgi:23S rRNA pseudouridine1911/1915/1917 synthase
MDASYSGIVEGLSGEIRLDRYAAEYLRLLSRSQIKSRFLEARVNGKGVKLSAPVKAGDTLELSWLPQAPVYLEAEKIDLEILHEDRRCVVINKAQGMVVHPGAGNPSGTLANALLWRRTALYGGALDQPGLRNGIVHRLDKDTSGVIIAAYDDDALKILSAQFKARTVKKRYAALVQGRPRLNRGKIHTRLVRDPRNRKRFTTLPAEPANAPPAAYSGAGTAPSPAGKSALTCYRVLKSWGDYSLLVLLPRTGRTHQIRVHLKHLGHPVLGDPIYGVRDPSFPGASLMLHAYSLDIVLPGEEKLSRFTAPLPERFKRIIRTLEKG